MYEVAVPPMIRSLTNLRSILEKAATHAETKKISPSILVNARLYPDMFPLVRQVQIATDVAKGVVSRLAGVEPPKYEDVEQLLKNCSHGLIKPLPCLNLPTQNNWKIAKKIRFSYPCTTKQLRLKDCRIWLILCCLMFIFTSQRSTRFCATMAWRLVKKISLLKIANMSDTTVWLTKYVSGDELAKATEDFDAAFKIAASNFENDEWYVDDCVNFIYDHISENLEHIGEDTIKNAIELVFVENVIDESSDKER